MGAVERNGCSGPQAKMSMRDVFETWKLMYNAGLTVPKARGEGVMQSRPGIDSKLWEYDVQGNRGVRDVFEAWDGMQSPQHTALKVNQGEWGDV